ncbi:MAG: T9SS type A sorting domain-containing protein [Thermaurantimonas sp.]
MVYTVNSSGVVSAVSTIFDQYDIDLTNNFAAVNIVTGSSSSGGSGGIESFGGLSQLLSQRNIQRLRDGKYTYFENIEALPAAGSVGTLLAGRGQLTLADITPVTGPEQSAGKVVTPGDLIGITNAIDVYSVDYFKGTFRLGSVLALESPAGKIYDHTKVVCDRLTGARMPEIRTVSASGHPFLMALLEQENGELDYNITFVMYIDENENIVIDNKWNLSEYEPKTGHRVFNMQVWSVSPHTTIQMVEDIINLAKSHGPVQFLNILPAAMPTVFVESGYYRNGKLHLKVLNKSNASRVTIRGLTATTETQKHVPVFDDLPLPEGQNVVDFEFPVGFAFDAGFNIANNATSGLDQIYVADGAWGVDYELTSADNVSFEALPQTTELSKVGFHLERAAVASAHVKEYFSIYRVLLPGAYRAMDLTKYSDLNFTANVRKETKVQVVVVKRGISTWAEQFRTQVTLLPGVRTYTVTFDQLKSANGGIFTAEDIISVLWVSNVGSTDDNNVEVTISDLIFRKSTNQTPSVQPGKREVSIFPNPTVKDFSYAFLMEAEAPVKIEMINSLGQVVETLKHEKLPAGIHSFSYQKQLRPGIYFVRIITGRNVRTGSVVITE